MQTLSRQYYPHFLFKTLCAVPNSGMPLADGSVLCKAIYTLLSANEIPEFCTVHKVSIFITVKSLTPVSYAHIATRERG